MVIVITTTYFKYVQSLIRYLLVCLILDDTVFCRVGNHGTLLSLVCKGYGMTSF